jgi:hypothetical protein
MNSMGAYRRILAPSACQRGLYKGFRGLVFSPPHSATDSRVSANRSCLPKSSRNSRSSSKTIGRAAVRVDHRPVVIAAPRNLVTMPPKGAQLGPITAANYEMRSWPVIGDPSVHAVLYLPRSLISVSVV